MRNKLKLHCILAVVLSSTAFAADSSMELGTSAPPGNLGGYTMGAFPEDFRGQGPVNDAAPPASSPVTGNLTFSAPVTHYTFNGDWNTWSHGYDGDVYAIDELLHGNSLVLGLPGGTKAFYFFLQPNFLGEFEFDILGFFSSGANLTINDVVIDGDGGAKGFGFYSDANDLLSVTITSEGTWPDGFAVGEFGINTRPGTPGVPDGGVGLGMLGIVLGLTVVMRRFCS